jgi:hypothetical protein
MKKLTPKKLAPKKKVADQTKRLSFRVSPELYSHVLTIATATGETLTGVLRRALLSLKTR